MTATATLRTGTWRRVLRYSAIADLAVMVVVGLVLRDPEALAFAGVILVGILLLRFRTGLAGSIFLGVALVDTLAWMAPAAWSNLSNNDDLLAIMVPASLAVISVTGALAAFGAALPRARSSSSRVAALVPQAAIAVFVVALAAGIMQSRGDQPAPRAGDVIVKMANAAFVPARLEADAGQITFAATNTDLFWHTFTIDALGVDVRAPVGASRRQTVQVEPGTYEFYCIPHKLAGMKGTLVVS